MKWKSKKFEGWTFIQTRLSLLGYLEFYFVLFGMFVCLFVSLFILGTSISELLPSVQLFPTQAQSLFHWYYRNDYVEQFLRTELPNTGPSLLCSALG